MLMSKLTDPLSEDLSFLAHDLEYLRIQSASARVTYSFAMLGVRSGALEPEKGVDAFRSALAAAVKVSLEEQRQNVLAEIERTVEWFRTVANEDPEKLLTDAREDLPAFSDLLGGAASFVM